MDNIETVLPHKKPMILIDEILDYDLAEKIMRTKSTIKENNIYYDKNLKGAPSIIGIEFMAQTIGCWAYYRSGCKSQKIGYLLGTRLYNNKYDIFPLNETYITEAKELYYDKGISSFGCLIYNNNEEVGSATINVYREE